MVKLPDQTKIFNRFIKISLIVYFLLTLIIYIFVFNSKPKFKILPNNELIKYVPWDNIFLHNITSSFLLIILGIFSLGLLSTIFYLYNLYLLAYSAYIAYLHSGSYQYTIIVLMSHGFFEIIGIVLSFYLSTLSLRIAINKLYKKQLFYIQNFKELLYLVIILIGIFFISSLIESFITPMLLKLIME